jgi:hypothetical protein
MCAYRSAFAGAGSARTPGDPDPEAQRDHVELLGDIFLDHVHRTAAARAALVGDVEDDLTALQMRRQVPAVALRRAACPGLRPGHGLGRFLGRGDGSGVLLEPFQGELELLGVDALGLAAVPGADQLPDRQLQLFQFRFQSIALNCLCTLLRPGSQSTKIWWVAHLTRTGKRVHRSNVHKEPPQILLQTAQERDPRWDCASGSLEF